ncbi:MAG TPA: hypothetical protein VF517_12320 [Thermoleophilaceae bacterium]|jgi:hypothetical protein
MMRSIGIVGALLAAAVFVAGCVSTANVAGVSNTCTNPATMNDGFFANRSVYFRISTQADPVDPSTNWVCYRIKVPNQPETAGRLDVNATTDVAPVARVTTDVDSRACTTTVGNTLPTTHPIQQGTVAETPFYIDAYGAGSQTWLCVEAGPVKHRVLVNASAGLNEPDVTANSDTAPGPIADTTPPPAGQPSTSCSAGAYGPATENVNAHLADRDLFLYNAKPADNEVHVCARLSSPQGAAGFHLGVKAAVNQVVDVQQSSDITPCTNDVLVLGNPPLALRTSPVGQTPVSVCVNSTRYTVVTGPVPPVVTFERDTQ